MWLLKEIETPYWVSANYHKIWVVHADTIRNSIEVYLVSYASKENRENWKEILTSKNYRFENLDKSFFLWNMIEQSYWKIKEIDIEFADAEDDI